jgi:hypothetical protein
VRRATTLSASNPFSISDNPVLREGRQNRHWLISSSLRSRFAPAKSWSATGSGPSPGVAVLQHKRRIVCVQRGR